MKPVVWGALLVLSVSVCAVTPSFAQSGGDLKPGDKLQTLANLHPDMNKRLLYTLNYQLPGLIPVCSDVTITRVAKKKLAFEYMGAVYEIAYDGFSKDAGVSFQKAVQSIFLGPKCDKAKMESLGKIDKEGIRTGHPHVGMTREGLLFAMGRPPFHANPDLAAPIWAYWRNRFTRMEIEFSADGKVTDIR